MSKDLIDKIANEMGIGKTITINGEASSYTIYSDGSIYNIKTKRFLSGTRTKTGIMMELRIDGKSITRPLHRLIAEYFIPNPTSKPFVLHTDGNIYNNLVENLKWSTKAEFSEQRLSEEDILTISEVEFRRYYHEGEKTRYFVDEHGNVYSQLRNIILRPNLTLKGYYKVGIYLTSAGKCVPVTVHKIVASIYHKDTYAQGYDVDHLDGNKLNNHISNLEWTTRSINIQRAFQLGLKQALRGNCHAGTIYPDELIEKACEYKMDGFTIKEIESLTNIPSGYLYRIFRLESRRNIVSSYELNRKVSASTTIDQL